MNQPFILIIEPLARIEITPGRRLDFQALVERGGRIVWNRDGRVRQIKPAVIRNALQILDDYSLMVGAARLLGIPKGAGFIEWEQAEDVDYRTSGVIREGFPRDNPPPHRIG